MKRGIVLIGAVALSGLTGWCQAVTYDDLADVKAFAMGENGCFTDVTRESVTVSAVEASAAVAVDGCAVSVSDAVEPAPADGWFRTSDDSDAYPLRTDPPSGLCVIFR